MGKSCGGILEGLGAAPDCSQTIPSMYYNPITSQLTPIALDFFSPSNEGFCNNMASTNVSSIIYNL